MRLYRDPLKFSKMLRELAGPTLGGMNKVCGLDLSPTRIGIAISDPAQQVAIPLAVLRNALANSRLGFGVRCDDTLIIRRLQPEPIAALVVGWPLPLEPSGRERSSRLRETRQMIDRLPTILPNIVRPDTPILLHDERFSTVMARVRASEMSAVQLAQAGGLDALAAASILQEYLDYAARSHTLLPLAKGDGG